MKFICNRVDLNKALSNVSHAVGSRTTNAILEGILVEADINSIRLTSTDINMTIKTTINAVCSDKFEFVVPSKLFSAIIGKLPDEDIIIDYDSSKNKINIKCGGSNSEIICLNCDDFPRVRLNEGDNVIYLSKDSVKKLIKKTAFSASTDDFNGILTGVLLEIRDKKMKMVAVDPYRIATYKIDAINVNDEDVSVVIPAKLISEVSKFISDEGDDHMKFEIIDNKVIMNFDNNKVIVNTYSGKFIDYERILNREGSINVRVKRNELMRSTERASLLATAQNNNLIKFDIEDEIIVIKSLNEEGNIEEKVEIIKDGDNIKIGLNSKYLKDVLSVIEEEEVIMNFKDSISPCIIKPLKGDNYKYLILPIRMN